MAGLTLADFSPYLTTANFALLISVVALGIGLKNYKAQRQDRAETRHGEISRLQGEVIRMLDSVHIRMQGIQKRYESAIQEAGHLPVGVKEEILENLTSCLAELRPRVDEFKTMKATVDRVNASELNTGAFLMTLQACDARLRTIEYIAVDMEKRLDANQRTIEGWRNQMAWTP